MIRVNLAGKPRKKAGGKKAAKAGGGSSSALPVLHLLLMIGTGVAGYFMYSSLNAQTNDLATRIRAKEDEQTKLEMVINQNMIYESRKDELARRIKVIADLKNSQLSPVVMLDRLADAIDRTRFVWLSNFSVTANSKVTMNGTANSLEALTQFYANLDDSGYFHNIDLNKFDDAKGNYTFSMVTDFAPPAPPKPAAEKGAAN